LKKQGVFVRLAQKQISLLPYVPTLRGEAFHRTRITKYNNSLNPVENRIAAHVRIGSSRDESPEIGAAAVCGKGKSSG
jgi:hypothetical protein